MSSFAVKALDPTTWPDFAALVERHGGVWGGCWCMAFHEEGARPGPHRREQKECRVRDGKAHAALVFDGDVCIGWCQFGPTAELPRIKHQKAYREGLQQLPDWRITCLFVDKSHRKRGVTAAAIAGALDAIARLGGGIVESYPEEVAQRTTSSSFLHNGSISTFERQGFVRTRRIGKNHWVVVKHVAATPLP